MSQEANGKASENMPKTEVVAKAKRRQYTAEYKLRILRELDSSQGIGETGALLRREGLYSSHLTSWRRQRERGELDGLAPQKRVPKPDPQAVELARLQRENERLRERLSKAELIIDVQKKLRRCSAYRSKNTIWMARVDPIRGNPGRNRRGGESLPDTGYAPIQFVPRAPTGDK